MELRTDEHTEGVGDRVSNGTVIGWQHFEVLRIVPQGVIRTFMHEMCELRKETLATQNMQNDLPFKNTR